MTVSDPGVGVITISPVTFETRRFVGIDCVRPTGRGHDDNYRGYTGGLQLTELVPSDHRNRRDTRDQHQQRDRRPRPADAGVSHARRDTANPRNRDDPNRFTCGRYPHAERHGPTGTNTVTFSNVTGITVGSFFVQGRAIGTATLTAQTIGYELSTSNPTVNPSGFIINSPGNFTTTVAAANTNIQITSARLDPVTLNWSANQPRPGWLVGQRAGDELEHDCRHTE